MSIVPTNVNYTYNLLRSNLISLNSLYPFLNLQIVGNSVMGKNIYVIKLGNGPNKVFYSGGIHANEWITSTLLMKFIEDYATAYVQNSSLYGYNINNIEQKINNLMSLGYNQDEIIDIIDGEIF